MSAHEPPVGGFAFLYFRVYCCQVATSGDRRPHSNFLTFWSLYSSVTSRRNCMEENISLKNLTTMKVGGSARFFISVQDEKGLVRALNFARENQLPVFVLGGGSNIV